MLYPTDGDQGDVPNFMTHLVDAHCLEKIIDGNLIVLVYF